MRWWRQTARVPLEQVPSFQIEISDPCAALACSAFWAAGGVRVAIDQNRTQTLCTLTSMLKFSKRRRYYQIRIDVLRRKIQESFGAFLLMWEFIFCDLRSLAHRWFCPIFCRRKTSTSTMLWRRWILPKRSLWCVSCPPLPLSGFWSWAKPLTPGRTICGYFARRWGIWGILAVLVRNSWPVFPIYIYI